MLEVNVSIEGPDFSDVGRRRAAAPRPRHGAGQAMWRGEDPIEKASFASENAGPSVMDCSDEMDGLAVHAAAMHCAREL